ncbi:chromosome partitioning protein ParB, partial [Kitasatospora sp. NPDC058263]
MSGRRGLGRGLGALIGPAAPAADGAATQASAATVVSPGTVSPGAVPLLPTGRGTLAAKAAAESLREQAEREQAAAAPELAQVPGA